MKKKIVLIIVPIILIIVVATIVCVLYFTADTFKANKELFWKYLAQNSNIAGLLENDKSLRQAEFKSANSYNSNGELNINIQEGENSSKKLDVITTARHDINTGRTYADATLKNGDIDLFKVSFINSGDIYAIKCDDVLTNYVGIQNANLKTLASKYGIMSIDNIPDTFDINEYISVLENTDEQNKHIVGTYLPIIQNNIPEEQYAKTKQNIEIDEKIYKANVYAVRLTSENIKQILKSILNTLQNDPEMLVLLSNKFSTLNMGIDYTDISSLKLKINDLIGKIDETHFENNLDIYIYEQDEKTIRTQIILEDLLNITYDQTGAKQTLTINGKVSNNVFNANQPQNNANVNEVIDLEASNTVQNTQNFTVIFTENVLENNTENTLKIIPDKNIPDENLTFTMNMSNIQNNSISNVYKVVLNYIDDNNPKSLIVDYNVNTTKAEQVEEIMELTSENTAIANNYEANQFSTFINDWIKLFEANLNEKLASISFDMNNTENNEQ